MARIRTIKPEFWEDDTIGTLSLAARLLFVSTWNVADDEGLLRWTPAYLKSVAFRYDWDITEAAVSELMSELVNAWLVYPFRGGKIQDRLAWIVNFRKHQRINRPQSARHIAPSLQNPGVVLPYLRRDGFICHLCGGTIPAPGTDRDGTALAPSLDHLVPRSQGGSDYPSNIRTAHLGCNKARGDRPLETFRQPLSVRSLLDSAAPPQGDDVIDSVTDASTSSVIDAVPDSLPRSLSRSVRKIADEPGICDVSFPNSLIDSVNDSRTNSVWEGKGREGKGKDIPTSSGACRTAPVSAQTVTAAWVDANRVNGVEPSRAMIGQVAKLAKELLGGDNDPGRVLDAAQAAGRKGFARIDLELTAQAGRRAAAPTMVFDSKTGLGIER